MTVHLSSTLEQLLRDWASRTGRDMNAMVEDAVRQYLASANLSDVSPQDLAATQDALLRELGMDQAWSSTQAEGTDASR